MSELSKRDRQSRSLRSLDAWDYMLFAELINICRYFPRLQSKGYISPSEEIPVSPERFLWAQEGYVILKARSDSWFASVGLKAVHLDTEHAGKDCDAGAGKSKADNNSSGNSSSADNSTANSSFDSSKADSSNTDDSNGNNTGAVDDDGSDWQTASSAHSDEPVPSSSSSTTKVSSTISILDPTENWRDIAFTAAQLRNVYFCNLPFGLSTLPLYEWSTYDVLRASLVGVFRTFSRIKEFLLRIFARGLWDGRLLWSMVERAAAAVNADNDDEDHARTIAESILGRVLVLCCPWRPAAAKRGWAAIVVGWIGALIEHGVEFESALGDSEDELDGSEEDRVTSEYGESDGDEQGYIS